MGNDENKDTTPKEESSPTGVAVYISVDKQKLIDALRMNEFLRQQNQDLKADIASLFIPSTYVMKKLGKSSNPMKMIAFFTDLVMHPEKYKPILRPFTTIIEKHKDVKDQVEEMMERTIREIDEKNKKLKK